MKRIIASIASLLVVVSLTIQSPILSAAGGFVVNDIRISGLERIQQGTILNYLPVKKGDRVTTADSPKIIAALYNTGFFRNVELDRQGNTLVVIVVERATIGSLVVTGNSDINTKQMTTVLKQMGITTGEVFQQSVLDTVERELKREYNNRGKYNAVITTSTTELPSNRVAVRIDVSEGRVAKIKEIRIIGNHAFPDGELVDQFELTTSGMLTFFTRSDNYNNQKMEASLEALRSFYLDRGFIKFQIESYQVQLSPDKKDVHITVTVIEGPEYTFEGYRLAGNLEISTTELEKSVQIVPGQPFSRQAVNASVQAIKNVYGNKGYGFPDVKPETRVDEENLSVLMIFAISPGQQVYVRRINFKGNDLTSEEVLRYDIRQEEGGLLALDKVQESQRRLRVKRYIGNAAVETVPVPGTNNQVDLNFAVTEAPSGEATATVGYGTQKLELSAAINQYNFMGTGKSVGLSVSSNRLVKNFSFNYFNPTYTPSGIGAGFDVYYQKVTPGELNLTQYTANRLGAGVSFQIPLSSTSTLSLSSAVENLDLKMPMIVNDQLAAFFKAQGKRVEEIIPLNGQLGPTQPPFNVLLDNKITYNQAKATISWMNSGIDRFPFPTMGTTTRLAATIVAPIGNESLTYFKTEAIARSYIPIFNDYIVVLSGTLTYGNQFNGNGLPFFDNFYSGGLIRPGQVRGFDNYSLGPRETTSILRDGVIIKEAGNPLGGNLGVSASAAVILPYPFSRDNIRTSVFVDAGNVYAVNTPAEYKGTDPGPVRVSGGLAIDWQSPMGPLTFSLAAPFNAQKEQTGSATQPFIPKDDVQYFQFSISTGI